MTVQFNAANVQWSSAQFEPISDQALQDVQNGNFGSILEIATDSGNLIIKTDKGKFTFQNPELETPESGAEDNGQVATTLSNLNGYDTSATADIYQIMTLLHELFREEKNAARQARQTQQEAQVDLLKDAASEIRQAAAFSLAAGIVTGAFQIASGGIAMAGGIKGGMSLKGINSTNMMAKTTQASNWTQGMSGVSQMAGGLGQMVSGTLNYFSTIQEAEQKEIEADAQQAGNYAQSESDFVADLRDQLRSLVDRLSAIESANNETLKTLMRA